MTWGDCAWCEVDPCECAKHEPRRPALLTRDALARELSISPSCLARLRREGLPTLFVAGMPRFELADALAWLRARSRTCQENEPESCTDPAGGGSPE